MTGTVIYTDFDGVINAFPDEKVLRRGGQTRLDWLKDDDPRKALYDPGHAFLLDRGKRVDLGARSRFRIRWSGELAANLADLSGRDGVELDWLSTWQPYTTLLDSALGWDPALVSTVRWYDPVTGEGRLTGKRRAVYRRVEVEARSESPMAVVWIDDEECHYQRKIELESLQPATPVLMVRPDDRIGISRRQWRLIADFTADPSAFGMVTLDEEPSVHQRSGHIGL